MKKKRWLLWPIGALAAALSLAQEAPAVRAVRAERIGGGVERPNGEPRARFLTLLPPGSSRAYEVRDGLYRSVVSRITLRVPRIGAEPFVDVREAVTLFRPDGTAGTTHVMFDPDGTPASWKPDSPVSAVVVTRLREDRPKDAESVIARLDGGALQREQLAARGIEYARIQTALGPALQRVVRNRAHNERFPYDLALLNEEKDVTYGVTDFVVVEGDSLVELSQIFPCASRSGAECKGAALQSMDSFLAGIQEFRRYPTSPAAGPASASAR